MGPSAARLWSSTAVSLNNYLRNESNPTHENAGMLLSRSALFWSRRHTFPSADHMSLIIWWAGAARIGRSVSLNVYPRNGSNPTHENAGMLLSRSTLFWSRRHTFPSADRMSLLTWWSCAARSGRTGLGSVFSATKRNRVPRDLSCRGAKTFSSVYATVGVNWFRGN